MSNQVTNIVVSGAMGRMGQAILRLASQDPQYHVVAGLESFECVEGCHGGINLPKLNVHLVANLGDLEDWQIAERPVVIEFSTPKATLEHVEQAARLGLKMVIGTTGLPEETRQAIAQAAEKTAMLLAPNMSLGVNVLLDLVQRLSAILPDYDIEITEMHHRHKKDAPSGTAVALGQAAASGRERKYEELVRHGREGMVGERVAGEIGMHALRGGDVVGEHTVYFAGEGERIELTHRASSRDTFAAGALRAAAFMARQDKGLFSMRDVLGLK